MLKVIILISLLIFSGSYVKIKAGSLVSKEANLLNKHDLTKNSLQTSPINKSSATLSFNLQLNTQTTISDSPTFESPKQPFKVKGIHITSWVAGSKKQFQKVINLIRETELNTVVIDLKEVDGIIGYEVNLPLAKEIKAIQRRIPDIDEIIALCNKYGIYKIARITVFKDNHLATKKPHLAVLDKSGNLWRDDKGQCWVNPYLKEVWEYNLALAKDAISHGFDEIQFDYVRFPSDGKITNCWYNSEHSMEKAEKTIIEFIKLAKHELSLYAFLSIDVFGLTTTCKNGIGIGQRFKEIVEYVDFISPMIYPSHYAKGSYGLNDPDSQPYKTISLSLRDAKQQIGDTKCRIRPWLQDFSLRYSYRQNEVRTQIKAVYDQGLDEWLLWNPKCRYTKSALLEEDNIKFVNYTFPKLILPGKDFHLATETLSLFSGSDTTNIETTITVKDKFDISKKSSTISSNIKNKRKHLCPQVDTKKNEHSCR